jgi:hypothetical protein
MDLKVLKGLGSVLCNFFAIEVKEPEAVEGICAALISRFVQVLERSAQIFLHTFPLTFQSA